MLNIGRLGAGRDAYYLDAVASGAEDYYLGAGEAPGQWAGPGCAALGLRGEVGAEALRAVLAGVDPRTGERLGRAGNRRTPGFDLTFRPPKSVSVLYGLGAPSVAAAVKVAHDAAVGEALGYLEREAAWSRRGHDGHERVAIEGFVAAAFVHRTSRAGDPLLHTHVVVANVARARDDGQWRTLDGRLLYTHAKTAGYLYQAQLRHELVARLGVEWGPVTRGYAEIAGIPRDVIDGFSRRRQEIVEQLAGRGEASARAAQVATLVTRPPKDHALTGPSLRERWAARAAELGFGVESLDAVVGRRVAAPLDAQAVRDTAEHLQGPEGLTGYASSFGRRDVIRGWAEQLPVGAASAGDVLDLTEAFLAPGRTAVVRLLDADQAEVLRRGDGRLVRAPVEPRWSTPELLELERRALAHATRNSSGSLGIVAATVVQQALDGHPSLVDEQRVMVQRLVTSGAGVEVVVGKAGSGKTSALSAAHAAWRASGVPVVGCALAARAAVELQDGSGIPSTTIGRLLGDIDRSGARAVLGGGVLVCDEAGMVGTRTLAPLLQHAAQAGCKVVLVGDPRQLPEIHAGGLYAALTRRLPVIELTENRRQHQTWERAALDDVRDGDPAHGIAALADQGRVHHGSNADEVRAALAADWWDAHRAGAYAVMVALRRSDVDDLNDRARGHLVAAGLVSGTELRAAGCDYQAGDHVVCTRNDRTLDVHNGLRGTVFHVDETGRALTIGVLDGTTRALPAAYLDAGHLTHGYAITGHKAQGATVDRAFVLGSGQLYREWGYVALSRARDRTDVYVVADTPVDAEHTMAEGLRDSRAQQLAGCDAVQGDVAGLQLAYKEARAACAHARDRLAQIARERTELTPSSRLAGAGRQLDEEAAHLWQFIDDTANHIRSLEQARDQPPHPPAKPKPDRRVLDPYFQRRVTRDRGHDRGLSL